jgi:hypothetical protein
MPPRYDPLSGYFGGALYSMRSDIQGKPEFMANIRPKQKEEAIFPLQRSENAY